MIRRLLAIASLRSLLQCATAVWLLARHGRVIGERHEIFSVYLKSRHARYTLRRDTDRVAFCVPPSPAALLRDCPQLNAGGIPDDPRPPATLMREAGR